MEGAQGGRQEVGDEKWEVHRALAPRFIGWRGIGWVEGGQIRVGCATGQRVVRTGRKSAGTIGCASGIPLAESEPYLAEGGGKLLDGMMSFYGYSARRDGSFGD